ncbi:MAG: phage/plasmid primase, P4 family [Armatimonas sp.]
MAALKLAIALFDTIRATHPRRVEPTWPELAARLTRHKVREGKDGQAWSPTLYKESATRGNAGVDTLCCLVLDFDDGTLPDSLIADWTKRGLAFVAHSTYSHAPDSPRWRAVFPLEKPMPAKEWKEIYQMLAEDLGHGSADPACKDPARMYYLPAHPPGIAPFAHYQVEGKLLKVAALPPKVPPKLPPGKDGGTGDRATADLPGEDYNGRVVQAEVLQLLQRYGWREAGGRDGVILLTRPGKTEGVGGVLGYSQAEPTVFYCYSSNAMPLEAATHYTPFALRATLEHGGRFDEAAKALAAEGYGKPDGANALRLIGQHLTDTGNAERMIVHCGQDLRYVTGLGWRVWDGACWGVGDLTIMERARETIRALHAEVARLRERKRAKADEAEQQTQKAKAEKLSAFAYKSESNRALKDLVAQASSFPAVLCEPDQFALQPWRVPFPNSTWDKGELRPHRRDDYTERLLAASYDPQADRTEWNALLTRMTGDDADLARTLQEVAGYALSGASTLRVLPWLYGPKGTGKSTFVELLQTTLGPTGKVIDPSLLSGDRDTERLGAAVRGMRAVFLAEAGRKRLDAELLKMMAGSDRIPGRELYGKVTFSVQPSWAVLAVSNDVPNVHAYDDALRDRVMALPFVNPLESGGKLSFTGSNRIEEVRRDPKHPLVLGFVSWAVDGLVRVHKTQTLYRAAVVDEHTQDFWEDADPLTPFWEGLDPRFVEKGMPTSELHNAYLAWHQNHRMMGRPLQGKYFAAACRAAGFEEFRTNAGRFWRRIPPPLDMNS